MKNLGFLFVLLIAGCSSMFAQAAVEVTNYPATGYYDGALAVTANVVGGGSISFDTGLISSIMPYGGTFSSGGGWFTYTLPNVGKANVANLAGSLTLLNTSASVRKYQMTMTFSGFDTKGRAVSGTSIQLITIKHLSGDWTVQDAGGTTDVHY